MAFAAVDLVARSPSVIHNATELCQAGGDYVVAAGADDGVVINSQLQIGNRNFTTDQFSDFLRGGYVRVSLDIGHHALQDAQVVSGLAQGDRVVLSHNCLVVQQGLCVGEVGGSSLDDRDQGLQDHGRHGLAGVQLGNNPFLGFRIAFQTQSLQELGRAFFVGQRSGVQRLEGAGIAQGRGQGVVALAQSVVSAHEFVEVLSAGSGVEHANNQLQDVGTFLRSNSHMKILHYSPGN